MIHHEENAVTAIQLLTKGLEVEPLPSERRERILFHLSSHCRIAALSGLLGRADVASFHERLRASGTWRLRMLQERAIQARPYNRFTGTAQIAPLCDALAAGTVPLARDIARVSAQDWLARKEFEDDFYYGRLLCRLVTNNTVDAPSPNELLSELIRATGDDSAPRVSVCKALMARDPDAFLAALLELLERRGAWFRARAGTLQARAPGFDVERSVCVEGLALLRIAALHDLPVDPEPEYPFLPSIVRLS